MTRPIFERFPKIAGRIPFIELINAPTPVAHEPSLGREIGYDELYVKRDDQSAADYGGNKPRKLEFLLARAKTEGAKSVVTIGGIGTNHGLATAIFARKLGLSCHLVLFDQPVTHYVRKNLLLFHRFGAVCHYAGGYAKTAWIVAREMVRSRFTPGGGTFLVPPGGSSALGCLGFIDAALELERQVQSGVLPCPSYIFCAVGSCGTYAGLLAGLKLTALPTRVIGVRVVDKIVVNAASILKYANGALDLLREAGEKIGDARVAASDVTVLDDFFGGEYGRVTPEGQAAVDLASRHGLKLETTYTGKAFAGMASFLSDRSARLGPAVFWNTYNSVDLNAEMAKISPLDLDPVFRRFLGEAR